MIVNNGVLFTYFSYMRPLIIRFKTDCFTHIAYLWFVFCFHISFITLNSYARDLHYRTLLWWLFCPFWSIYLSSMIKEQLGHSAKCLVLYFIEERKLYDPYNGFRMYSVTQSVFHPDGEPF